MRKELIENESNTIIYYIFTCNYINIILYLFLKSEYLKISYGKLKRL